MVSGRQSPRRCLAWTSTQGSDSQTLLGLEPAAWPGTEPARHCLARNRAGQTLLGPEQSRPDTAWPGTEPARHCLARNRAGQTLLGPEQSRPDTAWPGTEPARHCLARDRAGQTLLGPEQSRPDTAWPGTEHTRTLAHPRKDGLVMQLLLCQLSTVLAAVCNEGTT